ncbi:hypothetical protein VJI77_02510 [Parvimonas sp. D2]|uniref:hypothetical protein n=1 Tax=unclassified Parvimonas TaxID=1151464 RepID=UPI002B49B3E9|nr:MULTISPECIES: hypothetical protein [unclassified Parvimonas]MEB3011878.1 hypothetical protein [Parvimonas sp. D2]MEB3087370.1 hypothetical protein [Parvimonas sp. D4]
MKQSKLWTLIKYFVSIDFFAILSIRQNLKTKGKRAASFQGAAGIIFLAIMFIWGAPKLGKFLASNFQTAIGSASITTFSVGIFVITLFLSLATAFVFIEKNNETEILLSLPVSGSDIFLSRIYSLAITFFISFFLIFVIAFGVTGYTLGKGIDFYIFTFLGLILLNLEAILLTGVIILIFGKLLRTSKIFNRFLKLIYGLFTIGLFIVYMIFTQAASNPALGVNLGKILVDFDKKLSSIFFFVVWIKKIVISNDIMTSVVNLGIGLIICIILSFLLKFFAERNYLEILRSVNVVSQESKAVIEKRKKQGVAHARQYKLIVLIKKEFNQIITTPTYFMQVVMIDLMVVIMSCIAVYYGLKFKSQFKFAVNFVVSNQPIGYLLAIAFGIGAILGLFCGLSSLTTSSVSREGKAFWVIATAPIGINTHIMSRIIACQVLHFISAIIVILLSMILYIFNPILYLAVILGMSLTLFTSGSLNMILGLINPYFDWKTPKEAMNGGSGGISVFVSILINYGLYALLIFVTVKMIKWDYKVPAVILANICIILLTAIISYLIDRKLFKRLLRRL